VNLKIQILNVEVTTKQGKKPYQNANVAYKDLIKNEVASKNITAYSKVFKVAADAQVGQVFDVVSEKNGDYWEWTSMERNLNTDAAKVEAPTSTASKATAAPRSNYETPEERAKRQVYIVRQSSLSTAVANLIVGAKTPPKKEEIVALAQYFADFVFDADNPSTGKDLFDLPNDIEVE
jgi:hypothetical protein